MHRRLLLVAAMVVALAMVTAPVALAGKPTTSPFDYTVDFSMPGVCTFDLSVTAHAWGTDYYFPQKNGNLVDIGTATERDTFSANGHTLVGSPYWYAYREVYDSNGNGISGFVVGFVERVTLPDGTLFWSAGYVNLANGPSITPTKGHSGNVAAFCAAFG